MTLFRLVAGYLLVVLPSSVQAQVPCWSSVDCENKLRPGSQCIEGYCSNPFFHGGCLKSMVPDWNKTRVCGSSDPPEAVAQGYCRLSPLDYTEVRIGISNWESNIFGAWILQILLSEILDVPTSIESGKPDLVLDFYEASSNFENYGSVVDKDFEYLETSAQVLDCRLASPEQRQEGCAHVLSEVWWESYDDEYKTSLKGVEPMRELGALGENAAFIPRFAAENDTSLTSWLGYQDRRKMAETFRTPTRWKHYCDELSPTNCAEGTDATAARPPLDKYEESLFFLEGLYTGHFRLEPQNDCDLYPTTCHGHMAAYPCGWSAHTRQQVYHLGIALESAGPSPNKGYPATELAQMWRAANATQSPLLMQWWTPEPMYEEFLRSPGEFTRVLFPPPTQECVDARLRDNQPECVDPNGNYTVEQLFGAPEGACDSFPQVLQKAIGVSLHQISSNVDTAEIFWSPAYDAVVNYKLNNIQLGRIFDLWLQRTTDKWSYDPRDATCQWVVENLDMLYSYIPISYPRVIDVHPSSQKVLYQTAFGIAIVAMLGAALGIGVTHWKRKTKVLYYLQPQYLMLLQWGMVLVGAGGMVATLAPTTIACTLNKWLINLGYALQLAPLVYRIYKINLLAMSGKQMQHVRLSPTTLYTSVAIVGGLVVAFLLAWTILDAPTEVFEYQMTDQINSSGETVVHAYNYCGSDHGFWYYIAGAWKLAVVLPGCMLAFLASQVMEDRNDTKAVTLVLSLHLVFILLQLAVIRGMATESMSDSMAYHSLLLSGDTIFALVLYVLPKFWDTGAALEEDPLPDVFVHTTIALIDVDGFAPWASVREPVQVFQFLEKLYASYDKIAERYKVYKVETVGETYVAATGVPKPQKDHAVLMAEFAGSVMKAMQGFVTKEEVTFGPDTSDLCLRIALHSGPVTGGFLKGKGARFQLFGDVMTTAQLILANTLGETIQLSEATANLLMQADKKKWIVEREDKVKTLEKGIMNTFYLVKGTRQKLSALGVCVATDDASISETDQYAADFEVLHSEQRWIDWNTEVFKTLLRQIVARRTSNTMIAVNSMLPMNRGSIPIPNLNRGSIAIPTSIKRGSVESRGSSTASPSSSKRSSNVSSRGSSTTTAPPTKRGSISIPTPMKRGSISIPISIPSNINPIAALSQGLAMLDISSNHNDQSCSQAPSDCIPLEEVREIIELPQEFDKRAAKRQRENMDAVELPETVVMQLREFIAEVADMYNPNPFHNFAHASNVVMAVTKYMNRIIAASDADLGEGEEERLGDSAVAAKLHCHTFGITSDPITQFACVFSALIHDADHPGVPNPQLIKEDHEVANKYKERSVAEQKSLDLGLGLLMEDQFSELRETICSTPKEFHRFRALVINSVMATDLGDKQLKELRNGRWQKAFAATEDFSGDEETPQDQLVDVNRKATIVIEHLIQAADVAHMSQHWNIYRKWNERLFREMYKAYREGRAQTNPADSWYKGEIGFFDFYIIPLSKKLRDCGVFGPTSDENLNYATNNRNMWEKEGAEITRAMHQRVEAEYNKTQESPITKPLLR